jgi:DNA-binding MarR family transcriptional regulator
MEDPTPSSRPHRGRAKGNRQAKGRFGCINAFIDATMADLTPTERAVWLILWRDTQPSGLAATSQASMARRAGVTERAVRKALRRLEGRGLVGVVHRGSLRRGPSSYRVHPLPQPR